MCKNEFYQLTGNDIKSELSNLNQLTFEVTDSCNLKCKYCGYGELYNDYDKREDQDLDQESTFKLIDYLAELWRSKNNKSYGGYIYVSFYGGEPLLNINFIKNIIEHIEGLKNIHNKFIFSMTTNGLLLDKHIEYLIEKDFRLLISLDGTKNNNSYRVNHSGTNSFDRVYSNAKKIQEHYPDYFNTRVNFNSVLHNKNSVTEIHSFFKKEFNKITRIGELNTSGISETKHKIFNQMYNSKKTSLLEAQNHKIIEKDWFIDNPKTDNLATFLHKHSGNVFFSYNELLAPTIPTKNTNRIPTGTCLPFSKKMFVTVTGKILVCERIGHQHAVGNISKQGIKLDLDKIAETYNNYFRTLASQCSICYNLDTCKQCIFTFDTIDSELRCQYFTNKKQFESNTSLIIDYLRKNPDLYEKIMTKVLVN